MVMYKPIILCHICRPMKEEFGHSSGTTSSEISFRRMNGSVKGGLNCKRGETRQHFLRSYPTNLHPSRLMNAAPLSQNLLHHEVEACSTCPHMP